MKRQILVTDCDKKTLGLISAYLEHQGFGVIEASGYASAFAKLASCSPDVMVADISADPVQGIKAISSVRSWSELPIIAISGTEGPVLTDALDSGADICLLKPFSTAQLLAYIRVCLRRIEQFEKQSGLKSGETFESGGLKVDFDGCRVFSGGKEVHLTKNEFRILSLLCRYPGKVLTYGFIMKSIWGPLSDEGNGILRVNMTNIRRKIEPDPQKPAYIFTENGVGYRMTDKT